MNAAKKPTAAPRARVLLQALVAAAIAPIAWGFLMLFGGIGLVVAGVFVLLGLGPALLAAGFFCLAVAVVIFRGMSNG